MRAMRKLTTALGTVSLLALLLASTATAFEGGGRKPSEAPLITYGQRYSGQLNNHRDDANYGGYVDVAIYRLPPVSARDQVTVSWHALPFTHRTGEFPICMNLVQGINDFSWGETFGKTLEHSCSEGGPLYRLSGSGTAQTLVTTQETNSTSTYIEFSSRANETTELETYPYDFSVEAPRHYLGVAFTPVSKVATNGSLHANVTNADGSPAPDGLSFTLTATWSGGGIATYTAATVGGGLTYGLALPETAAGKSVTFQIARGADSTYQGAETSKLSLSVSKPKPTVDVAACQAAKQRVRNLARQYNQLNRRASYARGRRARRHLHHRAHRVGRLLSGARATATATCTPS